MNDDEHVNKHETLNGAKLLKISIDFVVDTGRMYYLYDESTLIVAITFLCQVKEVNAMSNAYNTLKHVE